MDFVFLTDQFYKDYPANKYPEIEHKPTRPYISICVEIDGVTFAVPMRSHIEHNNAYFTDKKNKCGIDYSKAVVIKDQDKYIDVQKKPHIRQNEFDALRGKEYRIKTGMTKYLKKYKESKTKEDRISKLLIQYSTLQYFDDDI